jgi:hypothetical protein
MLLCALRPEFEDQFEAARIAQDPLFANYPRPTSQRLESLVATWIASGACLDRLTEALNRACTRAGKPGVTTTFIYRRVTRNESTVDLIHRQIDDGLPCVLAWTSRELGLHSVCVVGYERYSGSGAWLRVLDPARIQDLLEWSQLCRLATGRLHLISIRHHTGSRPTKLTTLRDSSGRILQ